MSAEKLLADALTLSPGDRAKLAADLIASLPDQLTEAEQGYDEAWAEVIAARVDGVLDGTAEYESEPWEAAHDRVAAQLARRRKTA